MKLLAIDTSSLACTVGLLDGESIVARYEEQPREHTRILMPMVADVLAEAGLELGDLDGIALGNGPGSFIGMRIGAAVAQGLAHGAGLPVVPVSSMAAVAQSAGGPGQTVVVAQDAHMSQVYLGIYRREADGLARATSPECLHDPAPIAADFDAPATAAGAGFERYPALLEANRDRLEGAPEVLYPHARGVLALAAAAFADGGAIDPADLRPAYLRDQVAKKPGGAGP